MNKFSLLCITYAYAIEQLTCSNHRSDDLKSTSSSSKSPYGLLNKDVVLTGNTMGKIIDWIKDVTLLKPIHIQRLKKDMSRHGVIVIKNQNLSKDQQLEFTMKFGELLTVPSSIQATDDIKNPTILSVSNYFSKKTWKGPICKFGQYWHKDGNYYQYPKNYIYSILYAREISSLLIGGDTGFIDGCAGKEDIPRNILKIINTTQFIVKLNFIKDSKFDSTVHLDSYPTAHHDVIMKHPHNKRECIFLLKVLKEQEHLYTNKELKAFKHLWNFLMQPKYTYYHKWSQLDLVIWDNMFVFHRAMPFNDVGHKRILYRTLAKLDIM